MVIDGLLRHHATYRPNHTALILRERRLTFADLNVYVNRIANGLLSLGLTKGDKVATILPNCLEQVGMYWAVAKTGLVIVPMSPMLRGAGLSRLLNDSDSAFVLCDAAFTPHLDRVSAEIDIPAERRFVIDEADGYRSFAALIDGADSAEPPPANIQPGDPYNIFYSSGTTGLPKGIIHTQQIRAYYGTMYATAYRMTPESVMLHGGSLVFNGAMLTMMPALYLGTPFVLMDSFDPERFMELVEQHAVTHVKMVPSQIIAVLNAPDYDPARLQSLEMLGSVGAPLHREFKERILTDLPGRFYELYGLTEGFMTILDPDQFERKIDSVGVPMRGMEMRIVDHNGADVPVGEVGEIIGRGPLMMPGYYKQPEKSADAIRDGWLHSGDLGYVDEDGFLYLVDRSKDMIVSGGVNVYPRDIEEIIVRHPAVQEAAVFGVPDDKWGESPVAAVILQDWTAITDAQLRDWVNERVEARFQKLKGVELRDDFPRSTAGKTLKRVMRQPYWDDRDENI